MMGFLATVMIILYVTYAILAFRYCEYDGLNRPYTIKPRKSPRGQRRQTRTWRPMPRRRKKGVLSHD